MRREARAATRLLRQTGWNPARAGYLDGIPVTLMAGTYFTADGGDPRMWPYGGATSRKPIRQGCG